MRMGDGKPETTRGQRCAQDSCMRARGVIGEHPCYDVVYDRICEVQKMPNVVDEEAIGVKEAVPLVVGADGPDWNTA